MIRATLKGKDLLRILFLRGVPVLEAILGRIFRHFFCVYVQLDLNSLNTDGSFTMANSNSLLNPYILPVAQENKSLRTCYFIMKLYAMCTH